jgi:hypothetical protein
MKKIHSVTQTKACVVLYVALRGHVQDEYAITMDFKMFS